MIKITVDTRDVSRRMLRIQGASKSPVELFKRIHAHQQAMSGLMFRNLKRGGTYRGVYWPGLADQYTRKTDGVTVPAEGGVERLDGRGVVLGRLRPSGARVDAGSNLMRDTGRLSTAVATVKRIRNAGRTLELITPVEYAEAQNKRRPFTFFTDSDVSLYTKFASEMLIQ